MENTSPQEVKVIVRKTKSNAAIYLGIIGFVLAIPALLCITVCAGAAAGFSELTEQSVKQIDVKAEKAELVKKIDAAKKNGEDVSELQTNLEAFNNLETGKNSLDGAAKGYTGALLFFAVCWLGGFILSFLSKSGISAIVGLLLFLCGVVMLITSIMSGFGAIFGAPAAICYTIGGIVSFSNRKLPR